MKFRILKIKIWTKLFYSFVLGARCKTENDCNKDHCCARQHGEYICKRNLSLGRKCFIPKGGLDYSINEQCPCEEHLACRNIRPVSDDM